MRLRQLSLVEVRTYAPHTDILTLSFLITAYGYHQADSLHTSSENMADINKDVEKDADRPPARTTFTEGQVDGNAGVSNELSTGSKELNPEIREADIRRASDAEPAIRDAASTEQPVVAGQADAETSGVGAAATTVTDADRLTRQEESRLTLQSNWLAAIDAQGRPPFDAYEYPFYSDVHVVGEVSEGLGPYKLLNALPMQADGNVAIAIVLRTAYFEYAAWPGAATRTLKTNVERYHGGTFAEEFAALCSLCLGIRLKAGDANRRFDSADPLGRFQAYQSRVPPSLIFNRSRAIVPSALAIPSLDNIRERLRPIPSIEYRMLTELVRAARAYQDALWIAESEPNLAWLLLVSALEIAASAHVSDTGSPEENLREYQPRLAVVLESAGGSELVANVGDLLKNLYSATRKFIRFCEQFAPPPPEVRPSMDWMQIEWTWPNLKKILTKVYEHRSNALHAGIPFPAPMCRRPERWNEERAVSERAITGLAESTLGATWAPKDAPISLNAFQYIVRASLLKWWDHISVPT